MRFFLVFCCHCISLFSKKLPCVKICIGGRFFRLATFFQKLPPPVQIVFL
nr:MAG TPA: hypothetical protein [Caudoviricetes sp.]DAS83182.1 MAG TPA: hypothetical protein [Caudoviricetes sp.]